MLLGLLEPVILLMLTPLQHNNMTTSFFHGLKVRMTEDAHVRVSVSTACVFT